MRKGKHINASKSQFIGLLSCLLFCGVGAAQDRSAKSGTMKSASTKSASTKSASAPAVTLAYTLPRDAQVSLLIRDQSGQVVYEILHGAKRLKGPNREAWDARDERGKPLPAGKYNWKLLATQGLHAEYLMTLGTNALPSWNL